MNCGSCGFDNPEGTKFCEECGTKLVRVCPSCGREVRPTAKFCGECGTPLARQSQVTSPKSQVQSLPPSTPNPQPPVSYTPRHLAERIQAEREAMEARGAPEGERKSITALFADIKGSTDIIQDLDPEEARAILDPALQLMMAAVHRYEGYVTQSLGDGIFALFSAPIAHEDHPQRALYAALLMQEEGGKHAERLRREKGLNLQFRVGVNTGEVVLRSIRKDDLHTDYVPVGQSTNLASRMESLATPGSIIVSEHTHKLTEGYFDFKPLGPTHIKGFNEPIHIYEVTGVGPLRTKLQVAARRGLARFVGRQSEMEQLQRALASAKAGHGQIAGVMGEPGVGKSRLFYEFKLLAQSGCLVLETFSVSHGKAYPYLLLIDLLKNYFQLALHDDERVRREKITGRVLTLDRSLKDTLPYLFFLLGLAEPTSPLQQMDPQIRRRRILEAIRRLLLRESLNQPLIIVFEDLHWLDAETQAFLSLLSESVPTARPYRAGYCPERPSTAPFRYCSRWSGYWWIQARHSSASFVVAWVSPDQALTRSRQALTLAQEIAHPWSTAIVWIENTRLYQFLREARAIQQQAEALMVLCKEQGFLDFFSLGIGLHGWALTMQGQAENGINQIQQGMADDRATDTEVYRPHFLALLAEASGKTGQVENGLTALAEALEAGDKTGRRFYEAELYRLKGELLLQLAERSKEI